MSYPRGLPADYKPFHILELCSNRLVGVQVPFAVADSPVLLIGKGDQGPRVWLAAPTDPSGGTWNFVLKAGQSLNPAVKVRRNPLTRSVFVEVSGHRVLSVQQTSDDTAQVNDIDLRPVGLAVTGDKNGLKAGEMQLTRNTIENTWAAFAFGGSA